MTGNGVWDIEWIDRGREPQVPPDPNYPSGIDITLTAEETAGGAPSCTRPLPYPAKRIGFYAVKCLTCNQHVIITTAGRPDDPRSLQLACRTQ